MSASSAKNSILKKIRSALTQQTPIPFPLSESSESVFQPLQQDIAVEFAEEFTKLEGKFSFCISEQELHQQLNGLISNQEWTKIFCTEKFRKLLPENVVNNDISHCDASITDCELLIGRTGSILLSSRNSGRIASVYAPVHVCIAYTSQLVYNIKDALLILKQKYGELLPSSFTFATGPSRTADIEKTLVVGVHGPKEVYCFLVDDLQKF
ncbi:MAG: lactate utilization protein C [Chitinophagaceae bacterium]